VAARGFDELTCLGSLYVYIFGDDNERESIVCDCCAESVGTTARRSSTPGLLELLSVMLCSRFLP